MEGKVCRRSTEIKRRIYGTTKMYNIFPAEHLTNNFEHLWINVLLDNKRLLTSVVCLEGYEFQTKITRKRFGGNTSTLIVEILVESLLITEELYLPVQSGYTTLQARSFV